MNAEMLVSVGPQAVRAGDGADVNLRGGTTGEAIGSQFSPRYTELVSRGLVYTACNTVITVVSVGGLDGGAGSGIMLTNPLGTGKNLVLLEICVALASSSTGSSSLILRANVDTTQSTVTHTTPLVIQNAYLGLPNNSVALADSSAQFLTAINVRAISGGAIGGGSVRAAYIKDDVGGAVILSPGTSIGLQCAGNTVSAVTSLTWAELPI